MRAVPGRRALLWLLCVLRGARGAPAAAANGTAPGDAVALLDAQAKEEPAQSRRLWGFQWPNGVPDPGGLKNEAGKFVQNTQNQAGNVAGHVGNAAGGVANQAGHVAGQAGNAVGHAAGQVSAAATNAFNFVKDTFNNAKKLVEEGLKVVTSAVDAAGKFMNDMTRLFKDFSPLQPIFGATHGIVPLLTSQKNLGTLIHFLDDLLKSASNLLNIGSAVSTVSSVFGQLFDLFTKELSKLSSAVTGGSGGRRLMVDYSALLGGLNFEGLKNTFEEFGRQASAFVNRIQGIEDAIRPLLDTLKKHVGRRLNAKDAMAEFHSSQQKYEGAILSVVPTWQSVENLAIDVCGQTDKAYKEVSSLKCRVEGFAQTVQLPGQSGVQNIVQACDQTTAQDAQAHNPQCPGVSQSAQVRDMLSESAGALGWVAVSFEYTIKNSTATRIILGILTLIIGASLAVFGYRYKDCEFWIEGFTAGLVVFSIVASVVIVYFGVCRGTVINSCEPKWILLVVVILSIGCAFGTVKAQKAQMFLAGFDLGAILGGCFYIAEFHEKIFNTFISADSDETKIVMAGFLAAALVTGLILGVLTVFFAKPVIIVGTSGVGGFIVVVAFCLFFPHWLGWYDIIAWAIVTVVAVAVQYMLTAPAEDQDGKDEESENRPLFGMS